MLHHNRHYIAATDAERRERTSSLPLSPDPGELEAILMAAARGDGDGWSALVQRFTARVRRSARLRHLSSHDVEDVVQNTWLALLEHVDSVRNPEAIGAWLETTARRESLRLVQRSDRELPTDEPSRQHEAVEPVCESRLIEAERRAALLASIKRLPPVQRRLMATLLAHPSVSYAELSRTLATPIGSIGPTRQRSLARLRRDAQLRRVVGQEG